jgi:hypothetical protein
MNSHHHEHFQPHGSKDRHNRHPHLNLADLCQEAQSKSNEKSLKSLAVKALEGDLVKDSQEATDKMTAHWVKSLEQLDYRGTRVIEQKYGKSALTETLDATRRERYQTFGFVAREAFRVGLDVIEAKIEKR